MKTVGILIFPDVEVLDFCGPFEVFSVSRAAEGEVQSPFEIVVVAETAAPVRAYGGLMVLPSATIDDCPPLDILVVPGGDGTRPLLTNERLLAWVRAQGAAVETLTSVCTGSLVLAQAGFLDGLTVTTHWLALDLMRRLFPQTVVVDDQHVVENGRILTSAGISAGIDMALKVVARYHGETAARRTAKMMEYPYPETNARRVEIRAE